MAAPTSPRPSGLPGLLGTAALLTAAAVLAPSAAAGGLTAVAPVDAESERVGALFAGQHQLCSASVLRSPTRDLVITAAHCLSGPDGVSFVPGYRDGQAPHGRWAASALYVTDGWRTGRDPDRTSRSCGSPLTAAVSGSRRRPAG